jgi:hypothetical protein
LTPVLQDDGKTGSIFMTSVMAVEEAQLLCTIVLDNGTYTIIPPQALLPLICYGT